MDVDGYSTPSDVVERLDAQGDLLGTWNVSGSDLAESACIALDAVDLHDAPLHA